MVKPRTPSSQIMDIDELEEFLCSDILPDNSMLLSDMDGFLTAIAVGPELIPPSEWLPHILGKGEPNFRDMDQANAFFGSIMLWYNNILDTLNNRPAEYEPYIYYNRNEEPIFSDWAEGFLIGMSLRPVAWEPLRDSKSYGQYLIPILAHMPDHKGGGFVIGDKAYEEIYALLAKDEQMLSNCVIQINQFWKLARQFYSGHPKAGRNDPCPCGSGKKFKKCCGNT